jgi:hypothetical protein
MVWEEGGKYVREEKEKGTRGDKNSDKLQEKREVLRLHF